MIVFAGAAQLLPPRHELHLSDGHPLYFSIHPRDHPADDRGEVAVELVRDHAYIEALEKYGVTAPMTVTPRTPARSQRPRGTARSGS